MHQMCYDLPCFSVLHCVVYYVIGQARAGPTVSDVDCVCNMRGGTTRVCVQKRKPEVFRGLYPLHSRVNKVADTNGNHTNLWRKKYIHFSLHKHIKEFRSKLKF